MKEIQNTKHDKSSINSDEFLEHIELKSQMKRVWFVQKLFAIEWFQPVLFFSIAICLSMTALIYEYSDSEPISWLTLIKKPGDLFRVAIAGVLVGLMCLYLLSFIVIRLNGGPFRIGDTVQILSGKHKGRVGAIYDQWQERGQFRVELGSEARENITDVFYECQIIRVKTTE